MKISDVSVAQELLKKIEDVSPFSGSQYPYPLNQSLFGELNLEKLRHFAGSSDGSRLKEDLPYILALATGIFASLAVNPAGLKVCYWETECSS